MTKLSYIFKSFTHYLKANLLIAMGVAVCTMVLTGSLIIGDSVRHSLEQSVYYRLGDMTHAVSVSERYFRKEIAREMEVTNPEVQVAPVLMLEGIAVAGGGEKRVNRVQVIGVDDGFGKISNNRIYNDLEENEVVISRNLADRLEVGEGENILIRVKKASSIPLNAPFVSDEESSVALRVHIAKIADKTDLGRFTLKASQTAPFNLFISIDRLNRLMDFTNKANHLLIKSPLSSSEVYSLLDNCLTPIDAGLKHKNIDATNQIEISTERVFMEPQVALTLESLPDAEPIISYFVNAIGLEDINEGADNEIKEIPYSFISSLNNNLKDDEIILTQWAAEDLMAEQGDIIKVKYLEIGPLRTLIHKEADFILKEIVAMTPQWADSTRMPWLPGLSDAGHCREWDAGVPIDLDAIRDKDEEYWNEWKGAPKAYVSLGKAKEMWENRFGRYTAIRFPAAEFDESLYIEKFAADISPHDLGMTVQPVRQDGIEAARNGTDFSGLFLGLSFFILVASVILTALLFMLNLESRSGEVGIMSALGFGEKQVLRLFIFEGFATAIAGGMAGLILSILYTSVVFRVLNTLWYDIVRTNVLIIEIKPITLVVGFIMSIAISLGAIYLTVTGYQKRKTAELQKRIDRELNRRRQVFTDVIMWGTLIIPTVMLLVQILIGDAQNTMLFFVSGGLLLPGILLGYRKILININRRKPGPVRFEKLPVLNLSRNRGRSLTIIILLALGTFLVISTGSFKTDLFASSGDRTSGTGGFLFFAQSTMPVLYDMNDSVKRAEEGIAGEFTAVQFRQVEGDDASCLNLNRVAQPAILGVNPEALKGRFSFATNNKDREIIDPWMLLDESADDGTVPAIADQTVIKWGLGKKVGDVLLYLDEKGDTLRLRLIAGTTPSVFQGYILISNQHFLKHYPSSSGSYVYLIDGNPDKSQSIAEELQSVYRDYGWEMESTSRRLVEFYSVTNTYLSIFLALGALGMVLGTIGLAVILARTILERRREIAFMQAVGFSISRQFWLLCSEYLILLAAGILAGFITAIISTLPSFLSANTDASLGTVAIITGIILMNGVFWIAILSWVSLRKLNLAEAMQIH